MRQTYTIRQFIIRRYVGLALALVTIWIVGGIWLLSLATDPPELAEWVSISVFVLGFVGLLLLSRRLATLPCSYTITQEGIEQQWQTKPLFFFKQNKLYLWAQVASYKVDEDANGSLIKLSFKDGSSLTIAHSEGIKDDFDAFQATLFEAIERYNKQSGTDTSTGPAAKILQSPSFYETTTAKVMAVFIGAMLIALTIFQWVSGIGWDELNWWKTAWLYLLGIPYIVRVFSKAPGKYKA